MLVSVNLVSCMSERRPGFTNWRTGGANSYERIVLPVKLGCMHYPAVPQICQKKQDPKML